MTLNYDDAMRLPTMEVEQAYGHRDTIMYALGIGLGQNPLDEAELAYLYEQRLSVLPTMPVAMAFKSLREMNLGIDFASLVHGEQRLTIHCRVPPEGKVIGRSKVVDVVDLGAGKGALVFIDRTIADAATGDLLATVGMTAFCRGDGGFGGPKRPVPPIYAVPNRPPDTVVEMPTSRRAALIYRLSGDLNPLHVDPATARSAGFEQPILHGLATFGVVGWSILKELADGRPDALATLAGRFTSPVFPGDTLSTELWHDGEVVSARVTAKERGKLVFNNGKATLAS